MRWAKYGTWDVAREVTLAIDGAVNICRLVWFVLIFEVSTECESPVPWPRGLRRRSAAARLLRSWARIPPGAWMFFCCMCCVLSGRGLCDGLITRPEESYRMWCIVECDLETS